MQDRRKGGKQRIERAEVATEKTANELGLWGATAAFGNNERQISSGSITEELQGLLAG